MRIEPRNATTCSDPDPRLATALSRLLLVGLALAIALMVAGAILTAARPGMPVSHESSITGLPGALGAFDPAGFFDLGLLVLLVTPAARVVALLVAFGRRRLWTFVAVSVVVLVVLALSAFFGLHGW
jgi:uncharacterized membrane protein